MEYRSWECSLTIVIGLEAIMANRKALVQLDILSTTKGHDKQVITIEDDDPLKRAALAAKMTELITDGFTVLLSDGAKVRGYDAKTNEWLVAASQKKDADKRVTAGGQTATAIAPTAGG